MSDPLENIEVEQTVLGSILCLPDNLHEITGFLRPEHFAEPLHAEIYAAIGKLAEDGRAITTITLAPFFQFAEPVGELTVMQYIGRLMGSVTSLKNIRDHAAVVKEFSDRRQLSSIGQHLQRSAGDHLAGISQTASGAVGALDDIIAEARTGRPTRESLNVSTQTLLQNIEDGGRAKPITTGFKDLDKTIGGWRRQEFTILAARPSMGKSAFGAAIMLNAAKAGSGVMMFSLEMSKDALSARCLSSVVWNRDTPIPYADILNERLDCRQKERLREASLSFEDLPIEIDDQGGLTVSEIASRCRQQAAKFERQGIKLDLVIIDHLGKVRASKRYAGNLVAETGEVSNALANLGKDLDTSIVALHQLNRAVEGRDDKHPQLSDLRNSGDIEQDADLIGFLYRPSYYLERMKFEEKKDEDKRIEKLKAKKYDFELIIAKQRNGPCITVDLFADMANNAIRNAAKKATY